MGPSVKMLGAHQQPKKGALTLSLYPRKGAICREERRGTIGQLCLIDQVMKLLDETGNRGWEDINICDMEPETTLAAAVAAGARISTDVCCDVADYTDHRIMEIELQRNPSAKIIKAYIQFTYSCYRHEDGAERAVRFWSDQLHDNEVIDKWANEYDEVRALPCGMIYRETEQDVTLAWSERYPLYYIPGETFVWFKPVTGAGYCDVFIGTLKEDPGFLAKVRHQLCKMESRRWGADIKPLTKRTNWRFSGRDKRYLRSPTGRMTRVCHAQIMELVMKMAQD